MGVGKRDAATITDSAAVIALLFSVLLPFFIFFFSFSSSLSFASKFPHVNSTQGKLAVPDFGQVTVDYGK